MRDSAAGALTGGTDSQPLPNLAKPADLQDCSAGEGTGSTSAVASFATAASLENDALSVTLRVQKSIRWVSVVM